jgi:hypothetical protein
MTMPGPNRRRGGGTEALSETGGRGEGLGWFVALFSSITHLKSRFYSWAQFTVPPCIRQASVPAPLPRLFAPPPHPSHPSHSSHPSHPSHLTDPTDPTDHRRSAIPPAPIHVAHEAVLNTRFSVFIRDQTASSSLRARTVFDGDRFLLNEGMDLSL